MPTLAQAHELQSQNPLPVLYFVLGLTQLKMG